MVQMHPLSSTTNVTYEAEGGIRNPACQDDDLPETKASARQSQSHQQQQQRPAGADSLTATSAAAAAKKNGESCKIHEKSQELKEAMTVCHTRVPWRHSFNIVLAIGVSLVIILGELGIIPNQKIGFYCNDPKLSYKFTGDTISAFLLMLVTVVFPVIVMLLTEWFFYSPDSYRHLETGMGSRSRQFKKWYFYYTLGWFYLVFVVEIIKCTVGEPRPHFFDSCRPREMLNCTDNEFINTYECANTKLSSFYVKDSDRSFPSGHAAISIFMAVFLVSYLQIRLPERSELILAKPWFQCVAIIWGLGCSVSRITDHRHHWWDVLVGGMLGSAFACFVVRVPCRLFLPRPELPMTSPSSASPLLGLQPGAPAGPAGVGYASSEQRHQSVKKLLSPSSVEAPEDRELGEMPGTWTA